MIEYTCIYTQYDDGILVIRFDNSALVPNGTITVKIIEEEDDEDELLTWHIAVIAVAGGIFVVLIAFLVSSRVILHGIMAPNLYYTSADHLFCLHLLL